MHSTVQNGHMTRRVVQVAMHFLSMGALLIMQINIACADTASAPAPAKPRLNFSHNNADSPDIISFVLALLGVIAMILLLAWLLRKFSSVSMRSGGSLRILGGMSVGGREKVVLVQVGQEQVLIGVAPGNVRTLHVLEQPIPETRPQATGSDNFSEKFKQVLSMGKGRPS